VVRGINREVSIGSPSLRRDRSVSWTMGMRPYFGIRAFPGYFPVIAIFPGYRGGNFPVTTLAVSGCNQLHH
jgi:hypothetical protein